MIYGIVGHEGAKFTGVTEGIARAKIQMLLAGDDFTPRASKVVSGKCHLGGVDVWAIEEARAMGIATQEFPPRAYSWTYGYKPRNMLIAENCDYVVSIVVKELPTTYAGMRFNYCYHCLTDSHVKSGGCWTAKYAREIGKAARIIEI